MVVLLLLSGTHDAEEAATEYNMRLFNRAKEDEKKRNRGLGGLIRSRSAEKPSRDKDDDSSERNSRVMSALQIVGADPSASGTDEKKKAPLNKKAEAGPVIKKKGGLFEWLDKNEKDKEENMKVKNEKMNEIYYKRMRAKQFEDAEQKKG